MGGTCTCGRVQRSAFPEGVTVTVQYGPGVLALAVYLTQSQLLPYQRTAELCQEVATTHLEALVAAIRGALLTAPGAHADETGVRGDGNLHWLNALSTTELTAYFAIRSPPLSKDYERKPTSSEAQGYFASSRLLLRQICNNQTPYKMTVG